MMQTSVTFSAQNSQIPELSIFSILVKMVNLKVFDRFADQTFVRQFSQSKFSITKSSIYKEGILLSQFIFGSIPRNIVAIFRAINIFSSPIQSQNFFAAVFAKIKFIWISAFISTRYPTELSFFSGMMNKFFIAYFALCDSMMIEVIALSRAIKRVKSIASRDCKRKFAKLTGFFQKEDSSTVINH